VVAIAVSTGGPDALRALLPRLPTDFAAPVLIAQHIADGFADGHGGVARDDLPAAGRHRPRGRASARPGRVYLTDPARDLVLGSGRRLHCPERDDASRYRPSCDRLLRSVAKAIGRSSVGADPDRHGPRRRGRHRGRAAAGGATIAQDEASSLVFGMNREAIASGRVQRVLPLADIAEALCQAVAVRMR
jgi:two-component system chemotaxis response regulator CheB